jgi:hypothetical protein
LRRDEVVAGSAAGRDLPLGKNLPGTLHPGVGVPVHLSPQELAKFLQRGRVLFVLFASHALVDGEPVDAVSTHPGLQVLPEAGDSVQGFQGFNVPIPLHVHLFHLRVGRLLEEPPVFGQTRRVRFSRPRAT